MNNTPIMKIEGLGISFGGLKAVDDVSFDVDRNQVKTVIGPDFGLVVQWPSQAIAPAEPRRRGLAEAVGAFVRRIAAEIVEMRLQHRPDKRGDRVLRFADRKVDRRLARLDVGQKLMQPHERRAAFGLWRAGRGSGFGRGLSGGHGLAAVMGSKAGAAEMPATQGISPQ